jgi:tetratricopeptide (TPR) repeat protein
VNGAEWRAACRSAELELPAGFLERLFGSRLVLLDDEGSHYAAPSFRFAHGMLQECLIREAAEGGRLIELHGAVVESLLPRFVAGEHEVAERLARHLREAGRLEEALPALRAASKRRFDAADYDGALGLLDVHSQCMMELGLDDGHREWCENLIERAEVLWRQGALEQAGALAREALEHAQGFNLEELVPRARYISGLLGLHRGEQDEAEGHIVQALQAFDFQCRDVETAKCLRALALIASREGHRDVAFNCFLNALELCRLHDDQLGMAAALAGMGGTCPMSPEGNTAYLEEALNLSERAGNLYGVAMALHGLGEVARKGGKLTEAESFYRRAVRISQQIGAAYQEAQEVVSLALVLIMRDEHEEARRHLDVAWRMADRLGQKAVLLAMHAGCLASIALEGDEAAFALHFGEVETWLAVTTYVDPEALFLLERAGDFASARGRADLASAVWSGVAAAWRRRGDEARGAAVDAKRAG